MKAFMKKLSDPLFWLLCHLSGIAIPILIGCIVLVALDTDFTLGGITNGGQFALYSIAMLVTTFYILGKDHSKRLPYDKWFLILSLFTIGFSIAFFVIAIVFQNKVQIAEWIIEWPTIGLFLFCTITAFCAILADKQRGTDRKAFDDILTANQEDLQGKFANKYLKGGDK